LPPSRRPPSYRTTAAKKIQVRAVDDPIMFGGRLVTEDRYAAFSPPPALAQLIAEGKLARPGDPSILFLPPPRGEVRCGVRRASPAAAE
jgi:hypothetical protein